MIYTDAFEAFYKTYPKTGEKILGSQRYAKLSQKDRDLAIKDCVLRYRGKEEQFIPNVARYLLRRYWEEPLPRLSVGSEHKEPLEAVICPECNEREVKIGGGINRCEICYKPPETEVLRIMRKHYATSGYKIRENESPEEHAKRLQGVCLNKSVKTMEKYK